MCLAEKGFIYFYFKILFIYRDAERERQKHRQREKQAPRREPDVGLDPGSPGSRPWLQAALNTAPPGLPLLTYFKKREREQESECREGDNEGERET